MNTSKRWDHSGMSTDQSAKQSTNIRNALSWRTGLFIPLLLGVIVACGTNGAVRAYIPLKEAGFYVQIALYAALFAMAFLGLDRLCDKLSGQARANHADGHADATDSPTRHTASRNAFWRFVHASTPRAIAMDAGRILICWSPYIIGLFPGVLYWDTGDQLAQFFGQSVWDMKPGQIWDHHPFFDTYIYGAFLGSSHALTDSYVPGIFAHSLMQCVVFATMFAACLAYLAGKQINRHALTAIATFICFFPVFPIAAMSMSKDVTHTMFFLIWLYLYVQMLDSGFTLLKKPWFLAAFVLTSTLASLTQKVGMYVIVVCLLVTLAIRVRAKGSLWLRSICATLAVLVFVSVNVLLPTFAYPALNIVPGGKQAAIVVPLQMLGRAAHDHPDDITAEEKQTVDAYMSNTWDQISQNYKPYLSDPVTGYSLKGEVSTATFFKVWASIGLRHPMSYVNSFFSQESGWIAFAGAPASNAQQEPPYQEVPVQLQPRTWSRINPDTFGRLFQPQTDTGGQAMAMAALRTAQSVPVVNMLMYTAMWTSVLPCFVLFRLWRIWRRKRHENGSSAARPAAADGQPALFWYLFPYLLTAASLFAYPVSLSVQNDSGNGTRYALHVLMIAPLTLGLLLNSSTSSWESREAPPLAKHHRKG